MLKFIAPILLLGITSECIAQLQELIPFRKENKWGYSTYSGTIIVEPKYDSVEFNNGRSRYGKVYLNGQVGLIDNLDSNHLPAQYLSLTKFNQSDFLALNIDSTYSIIDPTHGAEATPKFDYLSPASWTAVVYRNKNITGVIIKTGNNWNRKFHCTCNSRSVVVGNQRTPDLHKFEFLSNDSLYLVNYEGKLIETRAFVIDNQSVQEGQKKKLDEDEAINFDLGFTKNVDSSHPRFWPQYSLYKVKGKFGLIKKRWGYEKAYDKSEFVDSLSAQFDYIDTSTFIGGIFKAKKDGKYGLIDMSGKVYVDFNYTDIVLSNKLVAISTLKPYKIMVYAKKGRYWGVLGSKEFLKNSAGKFEEAIPFLYDRIKIANHFNFFITVRKKLKGIILSKEFKEILEPKYSAIRDSYHITAFGKVFSITDRNDKAYFVNEKGYEYVAK